MAHCLFTGLSFSILSVFSVAPASFQKPLGSSSPRSWATYVQYFSISLCQKQVVLLTWADPGFVGPGASTILGTLFKKKVPQIMKET